jgi:phage FluMu gp28-like protein
VHPRTLSPEQQIALRGSILDFLRSWLRPYQLAWLKDTSTQKVANWARQTGKSECIGVEACLLAMEPPYQPDEAVVIISASEKQAKELMQKVVRWARLFDELARRVSGLSLLVGDPTTQCIRWWNGKRIMSLASNPATLAGYHGHVFWDECAKTPHDELVFEAIHPIISSNSRYVIRVTSTPWGDVGKFYDIMTALPDWSRHEVNIVRAVREGATHNVKTLRGQYDSITWAQNYLCKFVSNLSSAFARDVLKAAMDLYADMEGQKPPADARRVLGMDIGRVHDRSVLVWGTEIEDELFSIDRVRPLIQMPYANQEKYVAEVLRGGEISRLWIDATGIGNEMAENLKRAFPGIVEPIMFTNARKEDLVHSFQAYLERGNLALCPNNDLIMDLTNIRAKFMPTSKMVRYDSQRTATGHADAAWAAMMCLGALKGHRDWAFGGVEDGLLVRDSLAGRLEYEPMHGMDHLPTANDLGVTSLTRAELEEDFADDPVLRRLLLGDPTG